MKQALSFTLLDQQLWLSPLKAIYWEETRALILSDLHFGKSGHFRKEGIAVPQDIYKNDLHRLFELVQYFQPLKLIIVGDFFHSAANKEADLFAKWRNDHPELKVELVKGNHDILPADWYKQNLIQVHDKEYVEGPFAFVHEWPGILQGNTNFYFTGHIHPGVLISGTGRQSMRLPCFYFEKEYAILPAFGGFTGLATLSPTRSSRVFAIANEAIITLQ
ncbi:ligase-associated DNA damage response endonuclease PdeM [Flavihumibacter fluvii]|uniref:ligase-associated DNA damage response endonuclease PdeM n=1 Tax=Flavihumibacter fluvii TaxID=2838157 RepID=UPI001BDDE32A|nr:ligase-associated DNA damage response endonuclease PdeM [Flavihumibacter fluvii]ULQ50601.1 ligase-associated DNA damage response endonuclease PdeM [Flavihumibacter fluvii]